MGGSVVSDTLVYAIGIVHVSACAPKDQPRDEVLAAADRTHPTGLDHGWAFSEDDTFSGGEPNPCVCDQDPDRLHYLLVC